MKGSDKRLALAFAAPAVLLVAGLMYWPMAGTFIESLYSTSFISPVPRYIGLAAYAKVLDDQVFRLVVANSVGWAAGVVLLQNVFGFAVALLLNHNLPAQGLMRSVLLMPWVLPGVVAAILWRFMFDPQLGLINSLVVSMGGNSVAWLADMNLAMPAVVVAAVWKGFPFSAVVYIAGLQTVDQEQIEAATIDGAGAWGRLVHVILPAMRPVIAVNLLLTTILTFNYFDMIWVLTRGGPQNATQIFPTRIYELGFGQFRFGEAAVYGVFSILVLGVFVAAYLWLYRGRSHAG